MHEVIMVLRMTIVEGNRQGASFLLGVFFLQSGLPEKVCLGPQVIIEVGLQKGPCDSLLWVVCTSLGCWRELSFMGWVSGWDGEGFPQTADQGDVWQCIWRMGADERQAASSGNAFYLACILVKCEKSFISLAPLWWTDDNSCIWNRLGFLRNTKLCRGGMPCWLLWQFTDCAGPVNTHDQISAVCWEWGRSFLFFFSVWGGPGWVLFGFSCFYSWRFRRTDKGGFT